MLEDNKRETDPLDVTQTGWVGEATDDSRGAPSGQETTPLAIRLKIGAKKREIEIPLDKVIHLGRLDPTSNVFPEIDLSDDDVIDKAISRRHARILKQDNRVIVEDLGSVNGTFVNGNRLAPYLPETVSDGDTLQLGRLLIEIKIIKTG